MGNQRRVLWAIVLTGSFMLVEVIGGLAAGSLALLADAGHMLLDVVALTMTWLGFRLSHRPADRRRSFGYRRIQILAAFVNGITLILAAVWIVFEAVQRLFSPAEVDGMLLIIVASIGLVVNVVAFLILSGGDTHNLNMRGGLAHVLSDMLGSVAAVISGVVIVMTNWVQVDAFLSLLVAALVLRAAWGVTRDSAHILLEGTPSSVDVEQIEQGLAASVAGVSAVHHVHVWSLTASDLLMTLHVVADATVSHDALITDINRYLAEHWQIAHATIQIEHAGCMPGTACA
ncbi:MAG: cation diffusion facilitator family transporter [Gammaproteobacteria bacterium]|nr:cation diffusion facilitator family transporter [Gammaproteobacteria bacterium]